jgi:hypothetical protein
VNRYATDRDEIIAGDILASNAQKEKDGKPTSGAHP